MPAQPIRDQPDATRVPFFVPLFNPIAHRLLGAGIPLGPNALLTVRGRKTGQPRTTPVALVEVGGRRWVIGTFGEVNWVRNLRAAGEATITIKHRSQHVQAIELSPGEGAGFFRDVLAPYVRRVPLGRWLLGALGAGEILSDPDGSGRRHPVFELRPSASAGAAATPASDRE
jgi:deazaflavin-dependent oxidoreductase (nitroreductase family)